MNAHTRLPKPDPLQGEEARVAEIMRSDVYTCRVTDTLDRAARLMWDHDCGAVPVLDPHGHVVGMVTDRDICMAAYTRGEPLWRIPVTVAASRSLQSVPPDASLALAHHLMRMHRIRRLPVIDRGGNLVGILSLVDIIRHAHRAAAASRPAPAGDLLSTLADVCRSACPTPSGSGRSN